MTELTRPIDLSFFVPGKVNGAQRHRARIQGGRVHTHRSESDRTNGQAIRDCFLAAHPDHKLHEGPVQVYISAQVMPPKSAWPGKDCLVKPDWDNIGKLVCDALNRVVYRDDSQITKATVLKRYCEEGVAEGLFVRIRLDQPTLKPRRAKTPK